MTDTGSLIRQFTAEAQKAGLEDSHPIWTQIDLLARIPLQRVKPLADRIGKQLFVLVLQNGISGHPFMPEPMELPDGDITLGSLPVRGDDVVIPLKALKVRQLVAGPTQKGKSFYVIDELEQVVKAGIPVHVFDTQGDYAYYLPQICPSVRVIRFEDFRRNPFDGPIPRDRWLDEVSNYIRECYFFRDVIVNMYRDACDKMAASGAPFNVQSFIATLARLPKKTWKDQDAYQSLRRFIRTLNQPTYRCQKGFDLHALMSIPVVFDLRNMADDMRLFFIADLITWYRCAKQFAPGRGLELLLVLDELSKFYSEDAAQRSDFGNPFILEVAKMAAKSGIGLILADQTYASFHREVRANCQTKIILETSHGPSRREIAYDLLLSGEQVEYIGSMSISSESRRAVVQTPIHSAPLLVDVPDFEFPSEPVPYEPPDFEWEPLPDITEPRPERGQVQAPVSNDVLEHRQEKYLAVIASYPFMPATARDDDFKISHTMGTRWRQEFKDRGLIEEHKVNTYVKGGSLKILTLTEAGYALLDAKKISYKPLLGNGGIAHKFWQHTVASWLELRDWKVKIEACITAKRVDVGAHRPGENVAFEIVQEGTLDKEASNYELDIEDGWSSVVFCVDSQETGEDLSSRLPDDARAEIRLLKEFL